MLQGPAFGSLGDSLDDAIRTEFFSWFHLIEDGRDVRADGAAVARFRSRGGDTRRFATCSVSIRADGLMDRIALTVDGAFIGSPDIWQLARDITRSFIGSAIANQPGADQVQEIIRDLLYRPQAGAKPTPTNHKEIEAAIYRGERVIVRFGNRGEKPELPVVVSRGFAVYTGDRGAFTRDLTTSRFTMQNYIVNGKRMLEIAFQRNQ